MSITTISDLQTCQRIIFSAANDTGYATWLQTWQFSWVLMIILSGKVAATSVEIGHCAAYRQACTHTKDTYSSWEFLYPGRQIASSGHNAHPSKIGARCESMWDRKKTSILNIEYKTQVKQSRVTHHYISISIQTIVGLNFSYDEQSKILAPTISDLYNILSSPYYLSRYALLGCWFSAHSCGNIVQLHRLISGTDWRFVSYSYILSCYAGILEANTSRLRPLPPPWSAYVVPQWRSRAETPAFWNPNVSMLESAFSSL